MAPSSTHSVTQASNATHTYGSTATAPIPAIREPRGPGYMTSSIIAMDSIGRPVRRGCPIGNFNPGVPRRRQVNAPPYSPAQLGEARGPDSPYHLGRPPANAQSATSIMTRSSRVITGTSAGLANVGSMGTFGRAEAQRLHGGEGRFRPMEAVTRPGRFDHANDPQRDLKKQKGISQNYHGDASLLANQSADIPDNENCSLWITHLPPSTNHHMLLSQIRGVGRVFSVHINEPNRALGHSLAAAKLVFFDRRGAQAFYERSQRPGSHLMIDGRRARVHWNRVKVAQKEAPGATTRCRVLIIKGEPGFVNPGSLNAFFNDFTKFQIDEVITRYKSATMSEVEFRFGSFGCQAETARFALLDRGAGAVGNPVWEVRFGVDPCA
ncbi:hypothetical protein C8035_v006374 [Colletotrichum spinosum]|uniref:RRM domain-containing protein n=1 Tax=Colletotrichum spinosum TaxID=1347390 RepID=A0A4R8QJZ9_9PEZI|nr:hypothetical protein C8035_v006374 [Colletotrichum spinosum]